MDQLMPVVEVVDNIEILHNHLRLQELVEMVVVMVELVLVEQAEQQTLEEVVVEDLVMEMVGLVS
jgi:hypothetical protein